MTTDSKLLVMILAGGKSSRMGQDKSQMMLGQKTILHHVMDRLQSQIGFQDIQIALNIPEINQNSREYWGKYALPLYEDRIKGGVGPLAGILTALELARHQGFEAVLTVPCDAPFIPLDLGIRLRQALFETATHPLPASRGEYPVPQLVQAMSSDQVHPVVGLWRSELAPDLYQAITQTQIRKIDRFTQLYPYSLVPWQTVPHDPFLNINTPEDLQTAQRIFQTEGE